MHKRRKNVFSHAKMNYYKYISSRFKKFFSLMQSDPSVFLYYIFITWTKKRKNRLIFIHFYVYFVKVAHGKLYPTRVSETLMQSDPFGKYGKYSDYTYVYFVHIHFTINCLNCLDFSLNSPDQPYIQVFR